MTDSSTDRTTIARNVCFHPRPVLYQQLPASFVPSTLGAVSTHDLAQNKKSSPSSTRPSLSYVPLSLLDLFTDDLPTQFQSIPLYDWLNAAGIVPDSSATYALADLQAVVNNQWGADATWSCKRGALDQVSFGFTSIGSLADGNFSPTGTVGRGSNCPQ